MPASDTPYLEISASNKDPVLDSLAKKLFLYDATGAIIRADIQRIDVAKKQFCTLPALWEIHGPWQDYAFIALNSCDMPSQEDKDYLRSTYPVLASWLPIIY